MVGIRKRSSAAPDEAFNLSKGLCCAMTASVELVDPACQQVLAVGVDDLGPERWHPLPCALRREALDQLALSRIARLNDLFSDA